MWVSFKTCLRSRTRRCRRLLKYNFYILFCFVYFCVVVRPSSEARRKTIFFGTDRETPAGPPFNSVHVAIAGAFSIMWVRVGVLKELYRIHSIVVSTRGRRFLYARRKFAFSSYLAFSWFG